MHFVRRFLLYKEKGFRVPDVYLEHARQLNVPAFLVKIRGMLIKEEDNKRASLPVDGQLEMEIEEHD